MTIRTMIDAARAGNPGDFEKSFNTVISEKLGTALSAIRTSVYAKTLGLQEAAPAEVETPEEE